LPIAADIVEKAIPKPVSYAVPKAETKTARLNWRRETARFAMAGMPFQYRIGESLSGSDGSQATAGRGAVRV
jgi:hypothetical protein